MSALYELQRRVANAVMQPLTRRDGMRRKMPDGRSTIAEATELIKPNRLLSSFERLEIYNRQYWFRILNSFAEDFPGLRSIVGTKRFEALMRSYLADCPSVSFTLRNVGSKLESWLIANPEWIALKPQLALDMVRIEWAHIEAFDGASEAAVTLADLDLGGENFRLALQPYIRLLRLDYAVDDLLIEVHDYQGETDISSNSAKEHQIRRRIRHYSTPAREPFFLAVHRVGDSIYYKRMEREAYQMLRAFEKSLPLESAIDEAFTGSSMSDEQRLASLQQWFSNWSELGWFCRSRTLDDRLI